MKHLLLATFLMCPIAARAAEPATLVLPTPVVSAFAQYLAQRPYAEVAQLMFVLQGCISVQVPAAQGANVNRGECPAVTAALAHKDDGPAAVIPPDIEKKN